MTFFSGDTNPVYGSGYTNDLETARRIKLVQDAAPIFAQGDGIQTAMNFARSGMDDNAMLTAARTAAGTALVRSYRGYLEGQTDPKKQWDAWKSFDKGQQNLLIKDGYVPPQEPEKEEDLSPWGIVKSVAGDTLHTVTSIPGIHQGLEAINYAAGVGTHLYRAARLGVEEEGLFGTSLGRQIDYDPEIAKRRRNIFGDFLNLWGRTSDGEETFSIKAQERVHRSIPEEDRFAFVKSLAGGNSTYDYLTKELNLTEGTPEFEAEILKYSQYQGQEDVQKAVADLRNNKYSPGRDLARVAQLKEGTLPFDVVSGGVDATFRILSDPTLMVGKIYKGYRVGTYALDAAKAAEAAGDVGAWARRIDQLKTLPRFQAAADRIALRFSEGNPVQLLDELPQLRNGGLNDLENWLVKEKGLTWAKDAEGVSRLEGMTSEHVFDFFKENAGLKALGEGKFVAPHYPGTMLPSLNKWEQARSGVAMGIKGLTEDFRLADYGFDALEKGQLVELFGLKGAAGIKLQKGIGDALHSFYTKVPKYDFIGPDADSGIEQFRAMLDYSMPGFMRDSYVNDWIAAGGYAEKRAIYEAGTEAMFHYSGALQTTAGKKLLARTLRSGTYAADALDLHDGVPTGIIEQDIAKHWAIPDFKEMLKVTKDTTYLRRAMDYTNDGMMNRFMANYWKPAVLLKVGFIPRAYGEEYLGFILREGPKSWFKAQAAISATKEGYSLPLRPVGWLADSLLSHVNFVPGMNSAEIYARNFAVGATNTFKSWAERLAPDEYLNAARNLADQGGMSTLGESLGTSWGETAQPFQNKIRNETIGKYEEGEIVDVPIRHGEITTHAKGTSGFHPHTVLREMRRMQSDRLMAPLMDAGRRQIAQADTEQILNRFREQGLLSEGAGGVSNEAGLWELRHVVPDEVMPTFEKFLKSNSYASEKAVTQELIEHGVDPETAGLLTQEIGMMAPRHRVSIFTRDGELERMYKPTTLDPDAPFDVTKELPRTRQGVENESLREYREVMHTIWSPSPSTEAYEKLAFRRLNMADMQDTVNRSYRSRKLLDGRVVAEPPVKGTRRVYTILSDEHRPIDITDPRINLSSRTGEGPKLARINEAVDAEVGYVPFQSSEVTSLMDSPTISKTPIALHGGEQGLPEEMAFFTQDFRHAQAISEKMALKYEGRNVSVGYVDVPEEIFQQGRNLAKSNAAGGLDPLAAQNQANQTYIPKHFRDRMKVLTDDYQIIDDNYRTLQSHLNEIAANQQGKAALTQRIEKANGLKQSLNDIQKQLDAGVDSIQITAQSPQGGPRRFVNASRQEADKEVAKLKNAIAKLELSADEQAQLNILSAKGLELEGQTANFHAAVGVDRAAALQDWASVIRQRYEQVFEHNQFGELADLQHNLLDGRVNVIDVANVSQHLHPTAIGPAILEPGSESLFNRIVRNGFDVVGKGGNAMIRNQMFLHYYARRLEEETTRMARILGESGINDVIEGTAGRLGTSHFKLRSEWNALPEDIRGAVNPYEAMIARDPIPPSLRTLEREQQKDLAEAATALYEHDNPDLIRRLEKQWQADGVLGDGEFSLDDLTNSYLDLDEELRASIRNNGVPEQISPAFANAAELSADDWTQLRDALNANRHIYKTAHDTAMKGAINDTIPWVDDHRIRSQFQQHGRNLFPFWFAQENFIRRTANNLIRDPTAIRKLELASQALHNVGIVSQNDFGEDVFNIPATGFLMKTVAQGASFFGAYTLPIENPMTGQIKYMMPGLDTFDRIGPSFSPLVAIPLEAVARKFPELEQAKQSLLGERGVGRSIPEMLMPSYAYKFYQGLTHDPEADQQMVATSVAVAQQLEAAGHGLPENADPYEHDDWMKRIENHTRLQFMLKAVVGFFSPASPSVAPPDELSPEFKAYLNSMSLDEAVVQFTADHPDARAYTIFKTSVPSGAPLPVSEEAGRLIDEHADYFHRHPDAGPWLLPQSDDETGSSTSTFNKEVARGLRERKSLKDWYDDYYFASAATDYFDTKEGHEQRMLAAKGNPTLRRQLEDQYQVWKDKYLDEHKIFAQLLQSPDAANRRQRILDGMSDALDDPDAPEAYHKDVLRDLVDTYQGHKKRMAQYKRNTTADRNAREQLQDQFQMWVMKYVTNNPPLQAFYDRVIRPDMGA